MAGDFLEDLYLHGGEPRVEIQDSWGTTSPPGLIPFMLSSHSFSPFFLTSTVEGRVLVHR